MPLRKKKTKKKNGLCWLEDVLRVVINADTYGVTSSEVAEFFNCETSLARKRLEKLAEQKKIIKTNHLRQHPTCTNIMNVFMAPEVATNEPIQIGPGQYKNVYEYIRRHGHDEDYVPVAPSRLSVAMPRSQQRIEDYARRVENGEDLWHPGDMSDGFVQFGEIPCIDSAGRPEFAKQRGRITKGKKQL